MAVRHHIGNTPHKYGLLSSAGERDPYSGETWPAGELPYSPEKFWTKAVDVVTPHRAQQELIIGQLQRIFPDDAPSLIRGAVDTSSASRVKSAT